MPAEVAAKAAVPSPTPAFWPEVGCLQMISCHIIPASHFAIAGQFHRRTYILDRPKILNWIVHTCFCQLLHHVMPGSEHLLLVCAAGCAAQQGASQGGHGRSGKGGGSEAHTAHPLQGRLPRGRPTAAGGGQDTAAACGQAPCARAACQEGQPGPKSGGRHKLYCLLFCVLFPLRNVRGRTDLSLSSDISLHGHHHVLRQALQDPAPHLIQGSVPALAPLIPTGCVAVLQD